MQNPDNPAGSSQGQSLKPVQKNSVGRTRAKDLAKWTIDDVAWLRRLFPEPLRATRLSTLGALVIGSCAVANYWRPSEKPSDASVRDPSAAAVVVAPSSVEPVNSEHRPTEMPPIVTAGLAGTGRELALGDLGRECHGDFERECETELGQSPRVKVSRRAVSPRSPFAMSCVLFDPPIDMHGVKKATVTYKLQNKDHVAFKFEGSKTGWVRHFEEAPLASTEQRTATWPVNPLVESASKFCFEFHGEGPVPNELTILALSVGE
jgi:hypothetical protein